MSHVMELNREERTESTVAEAVRKATLHRFSLKYEDVILPHGEGGSEPAGKLLAFPFRRKSAAAREDAKTHPKLDSKLSLASLNSSTVDADGSTTSRVPGRDATRSKRHGLYGHLARHIPVPKYEWDERVAPVLEKRRRSVLLLPVLHPFSRFALCWRGAMLLFDLVFTAFWVPLNIAFCASTYGDISKGCTRSDLAGGIIYVLNLLMGFTMGAVISSGQRKAVVLDGPSMAYFYIRRGMFVVDALASVPLFLLISAIASPAADKPNRLLGLLSLLRLSRLLRLVSTVKGVYEEMPNEHYRTTGIAERISVEAMYIMILTYQFAVAINLLACIMILLAYYYDYNTKLTWYEAIHWQDLPNASGPLLWYNAIYWAITTATTTGQGQAPRQPGEQVVANVGSVYGLVFIGLLSGIVGRAMLQATGDASHLYLSRRKVTLVSQWARLRHLPDNLVKGMQVYFAAESEADRREHHFEAEVIEGLPSALRREVVCHIVRPQLQCVHILDRADPELLLLLAGLFRPLDVPQGHILCHQGAAADRLWIVERGSVIARRHKEKEAHPTTGMTCLLGEGVLLRGLMDAAATRLWTLQTTSPCRLWELHWADLEPVLRINPSIISLTLQHVRERLLRVLYGQPQHNAAWCELSTVLARVLKQPQLLDHVQENLRELEEADEDNGSLPLLLSTWLELGVLSSLQLGLVPGRRGKAGLVTMSLMSQSHSGLAAPSHLGHLLSGSAHPLGAPSLAIPQGVGSTSRNLALPSLGLPQSSAVPPAVNRAGTLNRLALGGLASTQLEPIPGGATPTAGTPMPPQWHSEGGGSGTEEDAPGRGGGGAGGALVGEPGSPLHRLSLAVAQRIGSMSGKRSMESRGAGPAGGSVLVTGRAGGAGGLQSIQDDHEEDGRPGTEEDEDGDGDDELLRSFAHAGRSVGSAEGGRGSGSSGGYSSAYNARMRRGSVDSMLPPPPGAAAAGGTEAAEQLGGASSPFLSGGNLVRNWSGHEYIVAPPGKGSSGSARGAVGSSRRVVLAHTNSSASGLRSVQPLPLSRFGTAGSGLLKEGSSRLSSHGMATGSDSEAGGGGGGGGGGLSPVRSAGSGVAMVQLGSSVQDLLRRQDSGAGEYVASMLAQAEQGAGMGWVGGEARARMWSMSGAQPAGLSASAADGRRASGARPRRTCSFSGGGSAPRHKSQSAIEALTSRMADRAHGSGSTTPGGISGRAGVAAELRRGDSPNRVRSFSVGPGHRRRSQTALGIIPVPGASPLPSAWVPIGATPGSPTRTSGSGVPSGAGLFPGSWQQAQLTAGGAGPSARASFMLAATSRLAVTTHARQVPPHPHPGPHPEGGSRTSGDFPTPNEPAPDLKSGDGNTAAALRVPEDQQGMASTSQLDSSQNAGRKAAGEEVGQALRSGSVMGAVADDAEAPGAAGLLGFLDHPSRNVSLDGGIAAHTLASWGTVLEDERRRGHTMPRPGSLSVFVPAPAGDPGVPSGMSGEGELPEGTGDEAGVVEDAQDEGREEGQGGAANDMEEVEENERLSCIAHTPRAFDLVDAGGTPSGAEAAAAAAALPGGGVRRLPRRRISDIQLGRSLTLQPAARAPGSGGGADVSGPSGQLAGVAEGQERSAPPQLHRAATQLPPAALRLRPGQQAAPEWHPAAKASDGDLSPVGSPQASDGSRSSRSFATGADAAPRVAPVTGGLRPSPRSLELRLPAQLPVSDSTRMRAYATAGGGGSAPYDSTLSLPPGEPLDEQDAPAATGGEGSGAAAHGVLMATVSAVRLLRPGAIASDPMEPALAARVSPKKSFAGFTNNSEVPRGGGEVLPGRPSAGQVGLGGGGLAGDSAARGGGGVGGLGAAGGCAGRAACPTCGKCTCQACRARALATAAVMEQGGAVVMGQRLPATALQIAMAARESNRVVLTEGPAGARGVSGTGGVLAAPAAAAPAGSPGAAVPWARGGAQGGLPHRGPSTQGRKRASITMDLAAPSVALAPY